MIYQYISYFSVRLKHFYKFYTQHLRKQSSCQFFPVALLQTFTQLLKITTFTGKTQVISIGPCCHGFNSEVLVTTRGYSGYSISLVLQPLNLSRRFSKSWPRTSTPSKLPARQKFVWRKCETQIFGNLFKKDTGLCLIVRVVVTNRLLLKIVH